MSKGKQTTLAQAVDWMHKNGIKFHSSYPVAPTDNQLILRYESWYHPPTQITYIIEVWRNYEVLVYVEKNIL